jgi:glycosyltransferase involved in cell wall biosynthesis
MHILLFFMYYLRPGDSGNKRFNEFCRFWLESDPNIRITVFTGTVNHYTGELHTDTGDALYVEKPDASQGVNQDRVRVIYVKQPDTYGKGFKGKAWSQMQWSRNCSKILAKWTDRPDVIVASSPPLWGAEPMLYAKRKWRIPAIVEERDLWPESVVMVGIAPAWHPGVMYLAWLERRLVRTADHFVALVRTARNSIVQRGLKREEDCSVFTNGVWLEQFDEVDPASRAEIRSQLGIRDDQILCVYIGQFGKFQRMIDIVEVADRLRSRPDIRIVTLGEGPDKEMVMEQARQRGLDNLEFLPVVPSDEVPKWLKAGDIGISFLNSADNTNWNSTTRGVMRNGMYDIAGARLPIVFNAHGLPRDMIEKEAEGGIFASTLESVDAYVAAIEKLAADPELCREMGERNYYGIAVKYNRRSMAAGYLEVMRMLIARYSSR